MRLLAALKACCLSLTVWGLGLLLPGCADDPGAPQDGAAGAAGTSSGQVQWCQVRQILQAKCQRCHIGDQGMHGAPFPLVTFADTQVVELNGRPRWESMRSAVEVDAMPPDFVPLDPPAEKVSASEKSLLLAWFNEGALASGGAECN